MLGLNHTPPLNSTWFSLVFTYIFPFFPENLAGAWVHRAKVLFAPERKGNINMHATINTFSLWFPRETDRFFFSDLLFHKNTKFDKKKRIHVNKRNHKEKYKVDIHTMIFGNPQPPSFRISRLHYVHFFSLFWRTHQIKCKCYSSHTNNL